MARLHLVNGVPCWLSPQQIAVLVAMQRAYPVSVCAGTLARVVWPEAALPPPGWRHALFSLVSRLRLAAARSGLHIEAASLYRWQLVPETAAAGMHDPAVATRGGVAAVRPGSAAQPVHAAQLRDPAQQGAGLGGQKRGQAEEHQQVKERRFAAAGCQSIEDLHRGVHAPQHEENR